MRFNRIGSLGHYGVSIELVMLKKNVGCMHSIACVHPCVCLTDDRLSWRGYACSQRATAELSSALTLRFESLRGFQQRCRSSRAHSAQRYVAYARSLLLERSLAVISQHRNTRNHVQNLPAQLKQNGQLVVPWLQQTYEWPDGYSLSLFVSELCTALNGTLGDVTSSAALVHPAPTQQAEEQYVTAPQFAIEEHEKRGSSCYATPLALPCERTDSLETRVCLLEENRKVPMMLPPADTRVLVFKCKWRNVQKRFTVTAPRTSAQLTQLIKEQFGIDAAQSIVLKEFLRYERSCIVSSVLGTA